MGAERISLLILHILGASIWIGGMLILTIGILPRAKKAKNSSIIKNFESSFHILGMVALTIQLLTGFRLAMIYAGGMKHLFDFANNHAAVLFAWKLVLIILTMLCFVMFKKKKLSNLTDDNISSLSLVIWVLTLLALGLMVLGLGFSRGIV